MMFMMLRRLLGGEQPRKVKVAVLPHGTYDESDLKPGWSGDSGVDLKVSCLDDTIRFEPFETKKVPLGVRVAPVDGKAGLLMMPRSSIYKTPLRLANSVGLIDNGYRGELFACLDNVSPNAYVLEKGTKLVQLVDFTGIPMDICKTDALDLTERGDNGFGSTGF
jgi:dUTP pyrophosphatase